MATLLVQRAGILTTVQDLGRPGWGAFGVPVSGAMDTLAARTANTLVGNQPDAPALELTGPGAALVFTLEEPRPVAVAGADLDATLTDAGGIFRPLPPGQALLVTDGETLRFPHRRAGARAMLAIAGGISAARTFGSVATDLANRLGGMDGLALRAGDRLALDPAPPALARPARPIAPMPAPLATAYADPFCLRFIPTAPTPVTDARSSAFGSRSFVVTPQSNRIGFRLRSADGAPLPGPAPAGDSLSEPIAPGTLQLPPDGQPILLMADRQTVGGYPVLGHVIAADLPKAAQWWPGDRVSFTAVSVAEAQALWRAQNDAFAAWRLAIIT